MRGFLWPALRCAMPAAIAIGAVAASTRAAPKDAVEHGRELFRIYCSSCHGAAGRGDGPVAPELGTRPPDLTVLSRDNGGVFPQERIRSKIDGRNDLASHDRRGMPIWGLAFQELGTDVAQDREVDVRLDWLVEFLRSIQTPAASVDGEPD